MIVLFHALVFAINELSSPVWQNDVRQIIYQVVEAMREELEMD